MFQVVARHCELIFSLLNSPKCDLVEVEKAMFQRFPWYFQIIFGLWTSLKCDKIEEKSDFSGGCKELRTHFLPLDQLIMVYGRSRKSDDSSCRMAH